MSKLRSLLQPIKWLSVTLEVKDVSTRMRLIRITFCVSTGYWIQFFKDSGIPVKNAIFYASVFTDHDLKTDMLVDLNKDYLKDIGIVQVGHIISILRHAKRVYSQGYPFALVEEVLAKMENLILKAPELLPAIAAQMQKCVAVEGDYFEGYWIQFFKDAGIPVKNAIFYASVFTDHDLKTDMLVDLNKDYLKDIGIVQVGHIISILRHSKRVYSQEIMEKGASFSSTARLNAVKPYSEELTSWEKMPLKSNTLPGSSFRPNIWQEQPVRSVTLQESTFRSNDWQEPSSKINSQQESSIPDTLQQIPFRINTLQEASKSSALQDSSTRQVAKPAQKLKQRRSVVTVPPRTATTSAGSQTNTSTISRIVGRLVSKRKEPAAKHKEDDDMDVEEVEEVGQEEEDGEEQEEEEEWEESYITPEPRVVTSIPVQKYAKSMMTEKKVAPKKKKKSATATSGSVTSAPAPPKKKARSSMEDSDEELSRDIKKPVLQLKSKNTKLVPSATKTSSANKLELGGPSTSGMQEVKFSITGLDAIPRPGSSSKPTSSGTTVFKRLGGIKENPSSTVSALESSNSVPYAGILKNTGQKTGSIKPVLKKGSGTMIADKVATMPNVVKRLGTPGGISVVNSNTGSRNVSMKDASLKVVNTVGIMGSATTKQDNQYTNIKSRLGTPSTTQTSSLQIKPRRSPIVWDDPPSVSMKRVINPNNDGDLHSTRIRVSGPSNDYDYQSTRIRVTSPGSDNDYQSSTVQGTSRSNDTDYRSTKIRITGPSNDNDGQSTRINNVPSRAGRSRFQEGARLRSRSVSPTRARMTMNSMTPPKMLRTLDDIPRKKVWFSTVTTHTLPDVYKESVFDRLGY